MASSMVPTKSALRRETPSSPFFLTATQRPQRKNWFYNLLPSPCSPCRRETLSSFFSHSDTTTTAQKTLLLFFQKRRVRCAAVRALFSFSLTATQRPQRKKLFSTSSETPCSPCRRETPSSLFLSQRHNVHSAKNSSPLLLKRRVRCAAVRHLLLFFSHSDTTLTAHKPLLHFF